MNAIFNVQFEFGDAWAFNFVLFGDWPVITFYVHLLQNRLRNRNQNPGIRGTEDTWKSNRIAIKFDQPSISWPGGKKSGKRKEQKTLKRLDQSGQWRWRWHVHIRPKEKPKEKLGGKTPNSFFFLGQSMLQFYTCFACESHQTNTETSTNTTTSRLRSCRKLEIFSSKFLAFLQNVLGPILLGSLSLAFFYFPPFFLPFFFCLFFGGTRKAATSSTCKSKSCNFNLASNCFKDKLIHTHTHTENWKMGGRFRGPRRWKATKLHVRLRGWKMRKTLTPALVTHATAPATECCVCCMAWQGKREKRVGFLSNGCRIR